jgi:tryptophan synthase alpha chain
VVGSALVNQVAGNLDADGKAKPGTAKAVLDLVQELADGVRSAHV